jgi:endonuclease III
MNWMEACGVDWMDLTRDREKWQVLVITVIKMRGSIKCGEFLDQTKNYVSNQEGLFSMEELYVLSGRTLLHGRTICLIRKDSSPWKNCLIRKDSSPCKNYLSYQEGLFSMEELFVLSGRTLLHGRTICLIRKDSSPWMTNFITHSKEQI